MVASYDPNTLISKSYSDRPILIKNSFSDGSTIRTYYDMNDKAQQTVVSRGANKNPQTDRTITYNKDGSTRSDSANSTDATTKQNTSSLSLQKEPQRTPVKSDQATKSPSSGKAPDDIRAKAAQFSKLDNYTGDITTPIIDMYKKPGETVTTNNSSITGDTFNYESTLSDGTLIHTKLKSDRTGGPQRISTDVTNSSGQTNVKYNTDGSKTEIFTPKDGSVNRQTVTYNIDGSVDIVSTNQTTGKVDSTQSKKYTKEQVAAKKTGFEGAIHKASKTSSQLYQNAKNLFTSKPKPASN